MPTVAFDIPDDPNGTVPTAHVRARVRQRALLLLRAAAPRWDTWRGDPHGHRARHTGLRLHVGARAWRSWTGRSSIPSGPGDRSRRLGDAVRAVDRAGHVRCRLHGQPGRGRHRQEQRTRDGRAGVGHATGGTITGVPNLVGGSGYVTAGGIKKFTDPLPLCAPPACAAAAPCLTTGRRSSRSRWQTGTTSNTTPTSDTYEIALVQYRMQFSSSMPPRSCAGYVQWRRRVAPRGIGGAGFQLINDAEGRDQGPASTGCLRCHHTAVPRADHRRDPGQAGPHHVPQPAAHAARTGTCSCRSTRR